MLSGDGDGLEDDPTRMELSRDLVRIAVTWRIVRLPISLPRASSSFLTRRGSLGCETRLSCALVCLCVELMRYSFLTLLFFILISSCGSSITLTFMH